MGSSTEAPGAQAAHPRRLGSYTTARVSAGRVERLERHASRLRRDAERLGLPLPARTDIERVFLDAVAEAFGEGRQDGVIRVEWSHLPGQAPELIPAPRPLGDVPESWRAVTSTVVHPGSEFRANTKYVDVAAYDAGRAEIRESDFEEVLLFDAEGFLVEGARSNFIVVTENGKRVTPDPALGPVEGLGLAIVRDGHPEITDARIRKEDLLVAQEIMAVNAVRGVVPIVELDQRPVQSGEPGSNAIRLGAAFTRA